MKMLKGPFTGRFYGNLPILYQKYLLDNISRIDESASDGDIKSWLKMRSTVISRSVTAIPTNIKTEQIRLMEGLCGLEFQPRGAKIDNSSKEKDAVGVTKKCIIPTNPSK